MLNLVKKAKGECRELILKLFNHSDLPFSIDIDQLGVRAAGNRTGFTIPLKATPARSPCSGPWRSFPSRRPRLCRTWRQRGFWPLRRGR